MAKAQEGEPLPGPWIVAFKDTFGYVVHQDDPDETYPRFVARTCTEANAKLIAAAPTMLEVLETIDLIHRQGDIGTLVDYVCGDSIVSAIQRAKGEEETN